MNWEFSYAIGFHPWEDTDSEFFQSLGALLDQVEEDHEPPYGRGLDVGTDSAIWGIELARRGWEVTGVDFVRRLSIGGASGSGTLILDTGTFHDFDTEEQHGMARSVDALATEDATVILLCWPRRRRPLIRGVSRDEIEAAFADSRITDVQPSFIKLPPPLEWLLRPDEHWYVLRRG